MEKYDVIIRCEAHDTETTETLKTLFPEALCAYSSNITGVEVMQFLTTLAALYAVMNVSSTIKDLLDFNKVEIKIGDKEVKGSYKHAVEIMDKYMQIPSKDSKETKS